MNENNEQQFNNTVITLQGVDGYELHAPPKLTEGQLLTALSRMIEVVARRGWDEAAMLMNKEAHGEQRDGDGAGEAGVSGGE